MISYRKLFVLLAENGMKKTDLLKVISSPTLAKLSKGEVIKTDIVDKICIFLNCQPGDIMEVLQIDDLMDKDGKIQAKLIYKDELEYNAIPVRNSYITFNTDIDTRNLDIYNDDVLPESRRMIDDIMYSDDEEQ